MGSIIGLDLPVLLELADACGYPRATMAQLITLAEHGVVAGINKAQEESIPENG